jgi:hypothetical protein
MVTENYFVICFNARFFSVECLQVSKKCISSNTNDDGTHKFWSVRSKSWMSRFLKIYSVRLKRWRKRLREEIQSVSRIRTVKDRLFIGALHTRFWVHYVPSWVTGSQVSIMLLQNVKFVLKGNSALTTVCYWSFVNLSITESLARWANGVETTKKGNSTWWKDRSPALITLIAISRLGSRASNHRTLVGWGEHTCRNTDHWL